MRIRGKRWLVATYESEGDRNYYEGMTRFESWAKYIAADIGPAFVVEIPPKGAKNLLRLGVHHDPTTLSELARQAGLSRLFIRRLLEEKTTEMRKQSRLEIGPPLPL